MKYRAMCILAVLSIGWLSSGFDTQTANAGGGNFANLTAYVMNLKLQMVQAVSLGDGLVTNSPKFEKPPVAMLLTPDQSRLLVVHRSRPKEMQALSILDSRDMKVLATLENFGNAAPITFEEYNVGHVYGQWDSSGKLLTVLCWGGPENDPELVQIDVSTSRILGRYTLDSELDGLTGPVAVVPGSKAALVFVKKNIQGKDKKSNAGSAGLGLVLANLRDISDCRVISLSGTSGYTLASPDGAYLYVVGNGNTNPKSKQELPAYIHVVSLKTNSLERTVEAGIAVTGSYVDTERGRVIFGSTGAGGADSRVIAVRGNENTEERSVPGKPRSIVAAAKPSAFTWSARILWRYLTLSR